MKTLFSAAELAGLPGAPTTKRGVQLLASRQSWPREKREGRGGGWVYPLTCLPVATRAALAARHHAPPVPMAAHSDDASGLDAEIRRGSLWDAFARKPDSIKARAARRRDCVALVDDLMATGVSKLAAIKAVAKEKQVSAATLRAWVDQVAGVERRDWLAALAPAWNGRAATAACSVEAWDFFVADYVRPEEPAAQACYDRLMRAAAASGWTVPSCRTLLRRLRREMPRLALAIGRRGMDAAKRMCPAQERDRSHFAALEAVNGDGHKFDVMVRFEDGSVGRAIGVFWQDLYSGKILAWRIDRTESAALVRLSFADLARDWGIPAKAWFDNGRAFCAKYITGRLPNRFRFKIKPEDPEGVLAALGVEIHWTKPYSGQSKPVERAFRDFCERIAKHPAFAGAYTGNRPDAKPENYGSRAVPIAEFLAIVAEEVRLHNAREGRRSDICAGRSFDAVFNESYAAHPVRRATAEQLRLLLLAGECVTAHRETGEIRLFGNRYWSADPALARLAGRKAIVRFDPERLDEPVHVYMLDGRYVATCARIEKAAFDDVAAARAHERDRRARLKAHKQLIAAERRMTTREVAALLPSFAKATEGEPSEAPPGAKEGRPEAKVVRLVPSRIEKPRAQVMPRAEVERREAEWLAAVAEKKGIKL